MAERTIKIDEITKIEGHANLTISIEDDKVKDVRFGVHEGSRYFESFMLNRSYKYLPDLSGRICGICTVAHEIASVLAVERALGIDPGREVHNIRKLMLYSSHLQSHVLHLFFLALPDYVNAESAIALASREPELVKKAFEIKEATNYLTALLGGRAVQPCTIVPGGHTKRITRETLNNYKKRMKELYPKLVETAELFLSLDYPAYERDCEYVALVAPNEIPLYNGEIGCTTGSYPPEEYGEHLVEEVIPYSSAKRSLFNGRDYMVGALARLNLNSGLRDEAKELAARYGYKFPSHRVAWINAAQALENVHFALKAMELVDEMSEYEPSRKEGKEDGEGVSAIEAPRGLLIHHYRIKKGKATYVNIITPTAMNTENIERTLRGYISEIADKDDAFIKMEAEKIIRAYDPCISCSVHVVNTK
ncbi:MAG: Ni/Fe hydrogenase subunit alpha [Euryarchaeota archaeon]|nr:Ni/Fe hydrogenase subunit alpha [Euryarchaeota archaeon]